MAKEAAEVSLLEKSPNIQRVKRAKRGGKPSDSLKSDEDTSGSGASSTPKSNSTVSRVGSAGSDQPKTQSTARRRRSSCHYCRVLNQNCGLVAGKCPNRPCDICNGRHRLGRCKKKTGTPGALKTKTGPGPMKAKVKPQGTHSKLEKGTKPQLFEQDDEIVSPKSTSTSTTAATAQKQSPMHVEDKGNRCQSEGSLNGTHKGPVLAAPVDNPIPPPPLSKPTTGNRLRRPAGLHLDTTAASMFDSDPLSSPTMQRITPKSSLNLANTPRSAISHFSPLSSPSSLAGGDIFFNSFPASSPTGSLGHNLLGFFPPGLCFPQTPTGLLSQNIMSPQSISRSPMAASFSKPIQSPKSFVYPNDISMHSYQQFPQHLNVDDNNAHYPTVPQNEQDEGIGLQNTWENLSRFIMPQHQPPHGNNPSPSSNTLSPPSIRHHADNRKDLRMAHEPISPSLQGQLLKQQQQQQQQQQQIQIVQQQQQQVQQQQPSTRRLTKKKARQTPQKKSAVKSGQAQSSSKPGRQYTMLRKRSACHFCKELNTNCGLVAGKCPNRPCDICKGRHRHGRCRLKR
mmetsp:Transcript_7659/g.14051  ORF Transcript_7659/g.14051 Transcript_7659/m.14051 type:complete len:566 (+) Transcript_7659:3-1700(+)